MYRLLSTEKKSFQPEESIIVPAITLDSIVKEFKLDQWKAVKEPNHRDLDGEIIDDSYYIRRENLDPTLPGHNEYFTKFVKNSYSLIQYQNGIKWLEPFLMEQLLDIDSTFMLGRGQRLSVTCNIGVEADVVPGDTVRRYLMLVLSHDGSTRMLGFTDIAPVCENTLEAAKAQAFNTAGKNFVLDESAPEKSLKKAASLIDLITQKFHEEAMPRYKALQALELEKGQIEYIFRTVLNIPLETEDYSDRLQESKNLLWGAYEASPGQDLRGVNDTGYKVISAVTNYAQFLGKTPEERYINSVLGKSRRLRTQTYELLESLLPDSYIPVAAG